MAVQTYASDQVVVIFGPVQVTGFVPDSRVTIEKNEARWTKRVGSDGLVTRSKTNDETATVTLHLEQTSMSNDLLSAISQLDRQTNEGVFPLMIKDNSGRSLYTAESAWIERDPNAEFGRESGERTWAIHTGQLQSHTGGN